MQKIDSAGNNQGYGTIPQLKFTISPLLNYFYFLDELYFDPYQTPSSIACAREKYKTLRYHNAGIWSYFQKAFGLAKNLDDLPAHLQMITNETISIAQEGWNDFLSLWETWEIQLESCKKKITEFWNSSGSSISNNIEELFKSKWQESSFDTYLVKGSSQCRGQSNPLILPVDHFREMARAQNILIHELLHRHSAYASNNSLYTIMKQVSNSHNITTREFGKFIHHTLIFTGADFLLEQEGVPFKLICWEKHPIKTFRTLANIFYDKWNSYASEKMTTETFCEEIVLGYRKIRHRP